MSHQMHGMNPNGRGNMVHVTAYIDPAANIGVNNYFGPHVIIGPNVSIGNGNRFESHVAVGMPAEHRDHFKTYGPVIIKNNNIIREFVTIQGGTSGVTYIDDNCVMLRGSHLSHDSVLESHVNVSCNVLIGGHTYVMQGANLGLGSIIHQHQLIGPYSMLGMGSVVTSKQDIIPGVVYVGNPAKYLKPNRIGINRANLTLIQQQAIVERCYHKAVEIGRIKFEGNADEPTPDEILQDLMQPFIEAAEAK